jgi:hypothetical protein
MANLVLMYDRPPEGRDAAYGERVRSWIDASMSLRGATSLVAYRNAWPTTPTNVVWIEFETLDEAEAALRHPAIRASIDEMRGLGASNVSMILLEPSPYTPEPAKP